MEHEYRGCARRSAFRARRNPRAGSARSTIFFFLLPAGRSRRTRAFRLTASDGIEILEVGTVPRRARSQRGCGRYGTASQLYRASTRVSSNGPSGSARAAKWVCASHRESAFVAAAGGQGSGSQSANRASKRCKRWETSDCEMSLHFFLRRSTPPARCTSARLIEHRRGACAHGSFGGRYPGLSNACPKGISNFFGGVRSSVRWTGRVRAATSTLIEAIGRSGRAAGLSAWPPPSRCSPARWRRSPRSA